MPRTAALLMLAGAISCLIFPLSAATGLVLGIAIALVLGNPIAQLTNHGAGVMLKIAIVALGAGMNLNTVLLLGASSFGYTLAGVSLTLMLGLWLGRRLGVAPDLSLLLTTGTAICGGSAIAAMSAAIRPRACDTTIALAVVFLLNAVALFVFPPLGSMMGFTQEQFGLWAALGIHDTSAVAGAASAYGGAALSVAVTVKLVRALWIVPLTLAAGLWRGRGQSSHRLRWVQFLPPWFIVGYVGMAALFSWGPVGQLGWAELLYSELGHRGMTLALFLIGTGFSREALRQTGLRPLAVAVLLWLAVSLAYAACIKLGWIG